MRAGRKPAGKVVQMALLVAGMKPNNGPELGFNREKVAIEFNVESRTLRLWIGFFSWGLFS